MIAIGAHIYAGGFTLGVREHFTVPIHLEDGKFGVETSEKNLGVVVHQKPWPVADIGNKHINLVYCNPPCAPWSSSSVGRANKWHEDERLSCQHDCFNLLTELQPDVWMLESVRGLYTKGKSLVMEFVAQAREMGYATYFVLTDAIEHGVPQRRKRFFLVFSKYEITWQQTYAPERTSGQVLKALGRDPDKRKTEMKTGIRWQSIVDKVEPGETMKNVFAREFPELVGQPNCGRGSFMLRRLDPDGPAPCFTGDVKTFHPVHHRFLTVGEAAALSSFPPTYKFAGATGLGYNQIARGVLPGVAEYMADMAKRAIKRAWHPQTLDPREVAIFSDRVEENYV